MKHKKNYYVILILQNLIILLLLLLSCDILHIASRSDYGNDDNDNDNNDPVAILSNLVISVGKLNPEFSSKNTEYSLTVESETDTIAITPMPKYKDSTITVNNKEIKSGTGSSSINLTMGDNTIKVKVKKDNEKKTYTINIIRKPDNSPPDPGNGGQLDLLNQSTSSITINWTKAKDNIDPPYELQYLVYYSEAGDISNIKKLETKGTPVDKYKPNITEKKIGGLKPETDYKINVLVKDTAGNKNCYVMKTISTDPLPLVEIQANKTETEEKTKDQVEITFERTDSTGDLTVNYEILGTASNEDYTTSSDLIGSIKIPDGKTKQNVTINIINDIQAEENETLIIKLKKNKYYKLTDSLNSIEISIKENPLIAHWNFNGKKDDQKDDKSGHGHNFVLYNKAELIIQDKRSSLSCNHMDGIPYADCGQVTLGNQFTIMGYLYVSGDMKPEIEQRCTILCSYEKIGSFIYGYQVSSVYKPNNSAYSCYIELLTFNGDYKVAESTPFSSSTYKWIHFALVVDKENKTGEIYINGFNKTNKETFDIRSDFSDMNPLRLGLNSKGTDSLWSEMADIRIYNYLLTQEEIENLVCIKAKIQNPIAIGSDDTEEYENGNIDTKSEDLELVNDEIGKDNQIVGLRFSDLNVPNMAFISATTIRFAVDEPKDVFTDLTIQCEDIDNSSVFKPTANNVSNRQTTTTTISWQPDSWTTEHESEITPDLSAIVQEVIDRDGWLTGNALTFIIKGTGKRTAESFEGAGDKVEYRPTLIIDYSVLK